MKTVFRILFSAVTFLSPLFCAADFQTSDSMRAQLKKTSEESEILQYLKATIPSLNFKPAEGELKALANKALSSYGLPEDTVYIFEMDGDIKDAEGEHGGVAFFDILNTGHSAIVIKNTDNIDQRIKTLYHEAAHIYHKHGSGLLSGNIFNYALTAGSLMHSAYLFYRDGWNALHFRWRRDLPIAATLLAIYGLTYKLYPYYSAFISRMNEKQADISACERMIADGYADSLIRIVRRTKDEIVEFEELKKKLAEEQQKYQALLKEMGDVQKEYEKKIAKMRGLPATEEVTEEKKEDGIVAINSDRLDFVKNFYARLRLLFNDLFDANKRHSDHADQVVYLTQCLKDHGYDVEVKK